MPYSTIFKGRVVWTVLLGATFVCCGLTIYKLLSNYKKRCTSQESCSNSYQGESAKLSSENCKTTCTTKECIEIANNILNYMNRSADPCDDFSAFACGNYKEHFARESNQSIFETVEEIVHPLIIKDIIETSNETQIDGSAAQKLKIVYDSCINTKSSERSAIRSMQQFLHEMGIPNWPHLDSNFSFRNPTFEETVGRLVPYQEDIFLKFVRPAMPPVQEQNHYNITVEAEAPRDKTYHDWDVGDLEKVVMRILYYTGMANEDINRTWKEFMDVENELRSLYNENVDVTTCYERKSKKWIDCSRANDSEIMLCNIWNSVVRNGRISAYINKDILEISCYNAHYIEKLPSVLNSYNHRTLAHYIALRVFINNWKYMSFAIRKTVRYMIKQIDTTGQDPTLEFDRWKFCVFWVAENMKSPLGLMYVSRLWGTDKLDELDDIVNEYKQTYKQSFQEQDWMDEYSLQFLIKMIEENDNVISKDIISFRNTSKINSDYMEFHPTRNDFFHNVMRHKKLQFIGKYWMTDAELDDSLFRVGPHGGLRLYLSFGMLLPPFFKFEYPKLFNIAGLGTIIGHELGHGISFPDPRNEAENATYQHYIGYTDCLIEQYFSYESKRIKQNVKGNNTIGENLADNMSLEVNEKIAEQMIRGMEADNFTLPSLPYSPEELFYISYAQTWCETRSIEMEHLAFEIDIHSPQEYRIIGPLQNSKRFSEVFHCPSTSYMNPEKKCTVLN